VFPRRIRTSVDPDSIAGFLLFLVLFRDWFQSDLVSSLIENHELKWISETVLNTNTFTMEATLRMDKSKLLWAEDRPSLLSYNDHLKYGKHV